MDAKGEYSYNFLTKEKWDQNVSRAKIFLYLQSNSKKLRV